MRAQDPASMKPGFYREGYNVRCDPGGLATRRGTLCPGALNAVDYDTIYGTGLFSNPNGLEWLAVCVSSGVWFVRDGEYPRFLPLPDTVSYPVEFSQAFDVFFIWRGPDVEPLLWHGDWAVYWETFPAPPTGSGRSTVPNAYYAETASNRMLVPYGKDRIAVSDIASWTAFDWTLNDFQVNQGESDDLVRIFPWQQETIFCFKRHSIYRITNFAGDLSQATLTRLPGSIGLVGRHACCQVSGTIFFMSHSGVFTIDQELVNTPVPSEFPVSQPIRPIIDSINWNAANLIRCEYRRDRVIFAVPLKDAVRCNAVLVFNIVTQAWESIDSFANPDFRIDDLQKMDYNGERRLFAIDRQLGVILLLEAGKTDLLGQTSDDEYQIQSAIMTRGYQGQASRSFFRRFDLDVASWNPKLTVRCYPDGNNAKTLISEKTADRARYETFMQARWNTMNSNDDHANPRRADYSVALPVMLGPHGIQIERNAETTERYAVNLKARYVQLKIENNQGYLNIRTISPDCYEDQREPRPHT